MLCRMLVGFNDEIFLIFCQSIIIPLNQTCRTSIKYIFHVWKILLCSYIEIDKIHPYVNLNVLVLMIKTLLLIILVNL